MIDCASCGRESPDGFRFCPHCGSALAVEPAAPPRTERKVVTVLFCDLVGFTARSDRADPEDVRALLRPFHAIARAEIERHGGTLDKFIGDAAMGVFGTPVAHEDDPERAVRTALRILEVVAEHNTLVAGEPIAVRVGVNTGEAIVTFATGVQEGENVAGDVVNTASRLQGAAPVGTVVVGETTYRATKACIDYEPLPPVTAKGKADPLPVWRATAARPVGTTFERPTVSPFVGRAEERAALLDAIASARAGRGPQLVTIVGEPGVGKSRLLAEVRVASAANSKSTRWVRGRCLPYGDGITFWALGEIVKEEAGILESDDAAQRTAKLDALLVDVEPDELARPWLRTRIGPLLGLDIGPPAGREESFTAWMRFFEALADREPLVLQIEDIHWADPALLAFVEHLISNARPIPLLVVATARPELSDRHPSWASTVANASTLSLAPLDGTDVARLIIELMPRALPEATLELLLQRSGGNPLYAEELVRAIRDRATRDAGGSAAGIDLPDSLQSLVAARLDTLPQNQKRVLQDASVIGRIFWSGSVAHLSGLDDAAVRDALDELARKELVRPVADASILGEREYSFWHLVVRDVAYGQMPRASRAAKHRQAVEWISSAEQARLGDVAEILAHHCLSAHQLLEAAGSTAELATLGVQAAGYLRLAATRTMALDVSKAAEQLQRALDLLPEGHPDRATVLASLAEAAFQRGRLDESDRLYEAAIDALAASGDIGRAADAMVRRSVVLEYRGETIAGRALLAEAIAKLEALPPGPELARALATHAGSLLVSGKHRESLPVAERAIALADEVGEPAAAARAHAFRGFDRTTLGDLGGADEQREALADLIALGLGRAAAVTYNNLGTALFVVEGPHAALEALREGEAFAEHRGLGEMATAIRNSILSPLREVGKWDDLISLGSRIVDEARAQGATYDELFAEADVAFVDVCRNGASALGRCERLLERVRSLEETAVLAWSLVVAATARMASGNAAGTADSLREMLEVSEDDPTSRLLELPQIVRLAVSAGEVTLAQRMIDACDTVPLERYRLSTVTANASVREASGAYEDALSGFDDAVRGWTAWGNPMESAHALFGAGRCLAMLGRDDQAVERLREAREAFELLGMRPTGERVSRLLERA